MKNKQEHILWRTSCCGWVYWKNVSNVVFLLSSKVVILYSLILWFYKVKLNQDPVWLFIANWVILRGSRERGSGTTCRPKPVDESDWFKKQKIICYESIAYGCKKLGDWGRAAPYRPVVIFCIIMCSFNWFKKLEHKGYNYKLSFSCKMSTLVYLVENSKCVVSFPSEIIPCVSQSRRID